MNGGGGTTDRVDFFFCLNAVMVDLTAGTATGEGTDTLTGIGHVFGSRHDDTITGDANPNTLLGDRETTRSPAPPVTQLVCGLPARMNKWRAPTRSTAASNSAERNDAMRRGRSVQPRSSGRVRQVGPPSPLCEISEPS